MAGEDAIYKYQPLWGKWFIDFHIGRGSFGNVYKVYRQDMGNRYTAAVKIISVPSDEQYKEAETSFGSDEATLSGYFEDVVNGIVREIEVLYSLSGNTNIINYQDHEVIKRPDELGWDILIRMEYVTSLRNYLREKQMAREEVVQLGIDICSALELCSKKGIVHRDIKDENIFVNDNGMFKLGDFGIARELSKSGRAASMRGTPLYMAPEVFRGEKYDAAVDIYSLGIVLYKLLNNGRMPFMPPYPQEIRQRHTDEALDKRMSGAELPMPDNAKGDALGRAVVKACAFDAGKRYRNPTDLKKDLAAALTAMSDAEKGQVLTHLLQAKPDRREEGTMSGMQGMPGQTGTMGTSGIDGIGGAAGQSMAGNRPPQGAGAQAAPDQYGAQAGDAREEEAPERGKGLRVALVALSIAMMAACTLYGMYNAIFNNSYRTLAVSGALVLLSGLCLTGAVLTKKRLGFGSALLLIASAAIFLGGAFYGI